MTIKSISTLAAAALVLCAGAAQAVTVNGFANGGFETTGPAATPAASWLKANSGYTLSTDARTGTYSAQLASAPFAAAIVLQNSIDQGGLPPLTAGDSPSFSFWAKGFAGTTGNVNYALRYLDGVGNILATSNNVFFQNSINTTTWTQFTNNIGAVPVGAVAAFLEFSQGIGPIGPGPAGENFLAGKVLIDDVYLGVASVTAVPEPTTYAMLLAGLGVVGFIVKRRRQSV
jgi:hypothetical protein